MTGCGHGEGGTREEGGSEAPALLILPGLVLPWRELTTGLPIVVPSKGDSGTVEWPP